MRHRKYAIGLLSLALPSLDVRLFGNLKSGRTRENPGGKKKGKRRGFRRGKRKSRREKGKIREEKKEGKER